MKLLKRHLYNKVKKYSDHKNAIVITGTRQVGKTSLLKLLYNDLPDTQKVWFDFENPLHYKLFEEIDYDDINQRLEKEGLDSRKRKYVFLDEIQNFPQITKIMKYLIDHHNIKFFVSGSSSFYMKNLFPESLSGRKFVFNLKPLDFQEFLYFKGKVRTLKEQKKINTTPKTLSEFEKHDQDFHEFMEFGGFPEVVLSRTVEEKKLILENIFKSFFEKDVVKLADFKDVKDIRDLILLLTQRIGSKLDITRLACELKVNRYKIYSYLEFLQSTFIIKLVSMFTRSVDRKVAAGKKVYFIDSGLVNAISQVSHGTLFENTVANLLLNYGELSYYQTRTGNEIDFIVEKKLAFEVKSTATKPDQNRLERLSEKLGIKKKFIVSKNYVEGLENTVYPQFL